MIVTLLISYFNPFNAEPLGHRYIPGQREGGVKKYFLMSDLSEDTSSILAFEQIIT